MDEFELFYEHLERKGADVKGGTLWYPGYYSDAQIVIRVKGGSPKVRWDGRGTQPSKADLIELLRLHHIVEFFLESGEFQEASDDE